MERKKRAIFYKVLFVTVYSMVLLGIIEVIFRHIPITHGVGYTLGSELWLKKYWKPINRFGFRDYEIDDSIAQKKKIFVLGDSFVAGYGIKNINNRFSNIIAAKLPSRYRVITIAENGDDTLQEIQRLNLFPYKPDILILFYSPNDIGDRALANGIELKGFTPYKDLNSYARFLIKRSYLLNFLYWQFPHKDLSNYMDFLKTAYSDKAVLDAHLHDLEYFVDYCKRLNIPLYVIVCPYLTNIENPGGVDKIIDFFNRQQVETISVPALIADIPYSKLVVNRMDLHPNEFANRIIADELWKRLKKNSQAF